MKKPVFLVMLFALLLLLPYACLAGEGKPTSLEGIEFFTGFGWGKLHEQGRHRINPLMVDFDFNLKNLTKRIKFNPGSLLQLQVEPFISFVSQPEANLETGTSFLLKMGILPETWKFQPFLLAGPGIVYMTQQTREQSTQFNFTEQAGAGIHYFFRKNIAFTVEKRWRHLSNASIRRPNKGITTEFVFTGISYKF